MKDYQQMIEQLLSNPDALKQKFPFTRGMSDSTEMSGLPSEVMTGEKISVPLPNLKRKVISQSDFLQELDPNCHDVLFDENIPSICVKTAKGGVKELEFKKISIPFQQSIKNKQTMHLAANPLDFTLLDANPNDTQRKNFITFKQYWNERNQDGMKYKMVDTQLSVGDAGLLYYFDRHGEIKSRLLSYQDGYVLCSHNDDNGDRLLECVYYQQNNIEFIDCYDDKYIHRFRRDTEADPETSGWVREPAVEHGFDEIPLITKRGSVAWNNVQNIIEAYEEIYNIFIVIERKHGWGILYIKGNFKADTQQIAGNVILNATNSMLDGDANNQDAKFLTPPSPQNMLDVLTSLYDNIQLGSSTTFILPKDIKMSGDVSGIAVQLTQSQDIELALQNQIEWQNVADKMVRLFKYGLSKELVNTNKQPTAFTEFQDLKISGKFKIWKPRNDYEYNQMIAQLTGAGLLSLESGVELNTLSKPDEIKRVMKEKEDEVIQQKEIIKTDVEPKPQEEIENEESNQEE